MTSTIQEMVAIRRETDQARAEVAVAKKSGGPEARIVALDRLERALVAEEKAATQMPKGAK